MPFVKTASRVTRLSDGSYEEVAFDAELPFYTGTGAEFLLAEGLPTLASGIVDYDALPDGETLLGYIVGGIVTPDGQPNPFVGNLTGLTCNALYRTHREKSCDNWFWKNRQWASASLACRQMGWTAAFTG
ncbi:MAG: hypothetical protein IPM82_28210 [Saprospiraceae bacterium]|nr:hypothetical protein [Saprospiraceae bacterium]